jgi:hypothetical protein
MNKAAADSKSAAHIPHILEWPTLKLATAKLHSFDIYRSSVAAGASFFPLYFSLALFLIVD